jgi:hypothetical protein
MGTGRAMWVQAPDVASVAQQQRTEEWLAMHRRPDALPLPASEDAAAAVTRRSIALAARRLAARQLARLRAGA